jgi:hypothetical protein
MRLLNFYLWLLNRDRGTELYLTWVDSEYMVIGKMHHLMDVKVSSSNKSILVETLKRLDKFAKAHYALQMWKGARVVTTLIKAGISERAATELVGQWVKAGKDPEKLTQHPEIVKVAAAQIEELMDRG